MIKTHTLYLHCNYNENDIKHTAMTTINFTSLEEELFAYELMSEEEATELYNVDYKEEALQYIKDYWI